VRHYDGVLSRSHICVAVVIRYVRIFTIANLSICHP